MSAEDHDLPHSQRRAQFAGRFERVQEVNRGGIGCIDAAHDPIIGRRVAIKTMIPEVRGEEPIERKFAEEAQITGQLEHPNIVPIYDVGVSEQGPFIVMKLVRGKSLGEMLTKAYQGESKPDDLPRYIQIVLRLCDALSFAHSRGVIHCDVKPDNVMVGDYGQIYLMDWGVAVLQSRRPTELLDSHRGPAVSKVAKTPFQDSERDSFVRVTPVAGEEATNVRGTPAYMAPEQLSAQTSAIDERTDVFGLGGILHEILTGEPPNDWQRLSGPGLTRETASLPQASTLWRRLPPELCRITRKALAPRPEDRYPTIDDLRSDLEQFLRGGGWFETRAYRAGESIIQEGDTGTAAYIIESGSCEVFKNVHGKRTLLRRLKPGDVFGETAVLTRSPRTASVIAIEDTSLKVITGESLHNELDRNPWLAAFVRSLATLFRETDARLSEPPENP